MVRVLMSVLLLFSLAQVAAAQNAGKRGGLLLQGDVDYGGDDIATVGFENGDSQSIKAGQGLTGSIGGWFRPMANKPFELQGLVGYKYVTTAADNADIHMSRVVLQLDGIYRFSNGWYLGGGVTQHSSPKLDGDGFFENVTFDDATGFTAEFGWRWIGLHYTNMKYKLAGFEDTDASNFGVRLTYRIGGPN